MPQNNFERRDYFQMQTEFRGEVRQQFTDLRSELSDLNATINSLATQFRAHQATYKVRFSIFGALGAAVPTAIAVLYMLLKG